MRPWTYQINKSLHHPIQHWEGAKLEEGQVAPCITVAIIAVVVVVVVVIITIINPPVPQMLALRGALVRRMASFAPVSSIQGKPPSSFILLRNSWANL